MSDFRIDKITNRVGDAGTQIAGITTFSGTFGMQLPSGPTAYRGGRGRGVFGSGGVSPAQQNVLNYITIATTGNAAEFGGDAYSRGGSCASFASATRGIWAGGYAYPGNTRLTSIDYVTISSKGGVNNFGDIKTASYGQAGFSDSTRGISGGGYTHPDSTAYIEYVTIATTGNASEFGEFNVLSSGSTSSYDAYLPSAFSSNTRGIWTGGSKTDVESNTIQYVTIQTRGNSKDFGDLTAGTRAGAGCGSPTRGITGGGNIHPSTDIDTVEYVTITTLGNATDFGNLVAANGALGACSSHTRGVWAGGAEPAAVNVIQYVTIASTGNTTDFGDLTWAGGYRCGFSDCHGGLA